MREIEVKAKLQSKEAIRHALQERQVELSQPVTQHDQVFGWPGADGIGNEFAWLRIRTETKAGSSRILFTLKRSVTGQLDSIEHETEISDGGELEKIILQLGYEPYSDLTKTRQKAHIEDIEICIDEVPGLGIFIEAEKLTDDAADATQIAKELWQLLESLGADRSQEVTDGYDVLMRKNQGLKT